MKISRKEALLGVISCVGMLFVAVGATVQPLYFLAWIGGPLTLGGLCLYYREIGKRKKVFLAFLLMFALMFSLPLTTRPVLATIYTGDDHQTWVTPECNLHVAIDTEARTIDFKWAGGLAIVFPPAIYVPKASYWKVEDGQGFYARTESQAVVNNYGHETLYYYNTGATWVKVKFHWTYSTALYWVLVDCVVEIYVPRIYPMGDLNEDGKVDILDVCIVTSCWQMHEGDAGWDPRADVNGDGTVDILDVCMVTTHWGEGWL